jgi:CheY-like chemotaxis protein
MAAKKRDSIVVVIVNTNPDIVWMLRIQLQRLGYIVVTVHIEDIKSGATDVEDFLAAHDPKVVVYDVAPPYDDNWRFLDHLRLATGFKGRRFVLTTVNVARLSEVVGFDETVYEIAGQADDIETIVRAVKEATRARATR